MRFLVLTQKIDKKDPVLGFFHLWLEELARQSDSVVALCLYLGEHHLPSNVKIFSLGKEEGISRLKYLYRFYKVIWREREAYDQVLVHMNQIYVILGAPLWRLLRKKIGLWYAHGSVSFSLRLAEKLTHLVLTSTPSGFRLPSRKVTVVGQGIDTEQFKPDFQGGKEGDFTLISVGRLSPVKGLEKIVKAVKILKDRAVVVKLVLIGGADTEDQTKYFSRLQKMVKDEGLENQVRFLGSLPNDEIIFHLRKAEVFVNMSGTGSLDKAILEAMACGLPIITSNEAIRSVLPPGYLKGAYLENSDSESLARETERIRSLSLEERRRRGEEMRKIVESQHNLKGLVSKIIEVYEKN